MSRRSRLSELDVARQVVDLAIHAHHHSSDEGGRRNHVGFYLVGPGLTALRAGSVTAPLRDRLLDTTLKHPHAVYFGAVALLLTLGLTALGFLCGQRLASGVGWSSCCSPPWCR